MPDHPEAIEQHKKKQPGVDQGTNKLDADAPPPGKGRPDKEEGIGTVQRPRG